LKRLHSVLTVVAVLAVGLLVAGCSDTAEKNEYVDTVNEIQTEMSDALTEASSAAAESPKDAADQLDQAASIVSDALTKLKDVDVPEDAKAGHDDLIAAIDETRALFSETASDLRKIGKNDVSGLFELQAELQESINGITPKIDAAIDKINKDIGATGA